MTSSFCAWRQTWNGTRNVWNATNADSSWTRVALVSCEMARPIAKSTISGILTFRFFFFHRQTNFFHFKILNFLIISFFEKTKNTVNKSFVFFFYYYSTFILISLLVFVIVSAKIHSTLIIKPCRAHWYVLLLIEHENQEEEEENKREEQAW